MSKTQLVGLKWLYWLPLFIILDQLSKWWVLNNLHIGENLSLLPGLDLTLAQNRGIAFSIFDHHHTSLTQILLVGIIIIICLLVTRWLLTTPPSDKLTGISLIMILGGALGNLFDRFWHGYVIDFIDFYVRQWHWYTFNLADSFITIGAILMLITLFFSPQET